MCIGKSIEFDAVSYPVFIRQCLPVLFSSCRTVFVVMSDCFHTLILSRQVDAT